jgi:flavin reductase (DIM6/NTAB) family NADH-FMN oxidoreductase RutF
VAPTSAARCPISARPATGLLRTVAVVTEMILADSATRPADDAPQAPTKRPMDLPVLYFGTPVVLIGSMNDDRTTNVAPMSSAWWLGETAMLGMSRFSRTVQNLERRPQVVLNLADIALVDAVDRIALLTGRPDIPEYKRRRGYTWCADKFTAGGMTPEAVPECDLQAVAEAPVHLVGEVVTIAPIGAAGSNLVAIEVRVQQSWVREDLLLDEHPDHMDPLAWDPLIMKFTEYFGRAVNLRESSLARGWTMPRLSARR